MLVGALAELTNVHVLAISDSSQRAVPLHGATTVTVCERRPIGTTERLLGPLPTVALWSRGVGAQDLVRQLVATHRVTHVLVSSSYAVVNVPRDLAVPLIVLALNVEHHRLRNLGSPQASPLRRAWLLVQAGRTRRLEQKVIRRAQAVVAISPNDLAGLRALAEGTTQLHLLPVVPEPSLLAVPLAGRPQANILFMGSLGYGPNLEAAGRLIEELLPRVRRTRPDARLIIAGSTPPPALQRMAKGREGVTIIANFDRTEDIFRRATVFVVPLVYQEGISIKTLSAFASGTPVVATAAVLRSVGAKADVHALAAEDPETMAQAVLRLIDDSSWRTRIAATARTFVIESFSQERLRSTLKTVLRIA